MRTRIAILWMLVGLALLAAALIRDITDRDMQRQEPTAPLQDIPAVVGLLACGAVLVAGGVAALARWSRPALMILAGAILLGAACVSSLLAGDARRREQAVLDRRWAEEARRATRRFPPALPGGRPAPAPTRGLPAILALGSGGVLLCGGGLAALVLRPRGPRHRRRGGDG
jgi:hypothetical protein